MKAEIISIGTELLLGETIDTNSNYLSKELPEIGIDLLWTTQVGDNFERLVDIFHNAIERSEIIFVTGGLGPTEDDITRETIAHALDEPLKIDKKQERQLRKFFAQRNREFPEKNVKQATIIKSAKFLDNPIGTAPGWWIKKNSVQIILMPGPPSEMKKMWQEQIRPSLMKKSNAVLVKKTIKTSTLGESNINQMVEKFLHYKNPSVGIYVKKDGVSLRIAAKAKNKTTAMSLIKPIERKLKKILKGYVWGEDDEKYGEIILKKMIKKNLTLGIIESVTGGKIADEITNFDNSSKYFLGSLIAYDKKVKIFSGLDSTFLQKEGTVSEATTKILAKNAKEIFKSSLGLAITGVAGSKTVEKHESGTLFISITNGKKSLHKEIVVSGDRVQIKNRAVFLSFALINEFMLKNDVK
ncbi:MAG: competence/damage-inducible protein A [Dehalococcoidaceae bacterium]|nr:competence/damage-inducible protein A [Dehalococcoidaceae bacterium]